MLTWAWELISAGFGIFLLIDKVLFYVGSHAFAGHAKNNFCPSLHDKRRRKLRGENESAQVHQSSGESALAVSSLKIDLPLESLKVPFNDREFEPLGRNFSKREG